MIYFEWFFENINMSDKPLAKLLKEREQRPKLMKLDTKSETFQ